MAESMLSPGDRELDRGLTELAAYMAYPPTPDIAGVVRQRLAVAPARPWLRRFWDTLAPLPRALAAVAAILIALAVVFVAASPETRTAIAERLGLRGVQLQQVPGLPTSAPAVPTPPSSAPSAAASPVPSPAVAGAVGSRLQLGQLLTLEQARARVAYQVQLPAALGAPDEVYLQDVPAGGQVALVFYPRPDLPQARTTGVGLLLTEFQGSVSGGIIGKGVPPGTRLDQVQVNGGPGYWIDGDPHTFFYLDARNQVRTETTRLAGSVLLWEQGTLTLRLESALTKDAALQVATSVR